MRFVTDCQKKTKPGLLQACPHSIENVFSFLFIVLEFVIG
jgi:hypothetical protein